MYFPKREQILIFFSGKFGSLSDCVCVVGYQIHALGCFRDNQKREIHFLAARLTRFQMIAQCSVWITLKRNTPGRPNALHSILPASRRNTDWQNCVSLVPMPPYAAASEWIFFLTFRSNCATIYLRDLLCSPNMEIVHQTLSRLVEFHFFSFSVWFHQIQQCDQRPYWGSVQVRCVRHFCEKVLIAHMQIQDVLLQSKIADWINSWTINSISIYFY